MSDKGARHLFRLPPLLPPPFHRRVGTGLAGAPVGRGAVDKGRQLMACCRSVCLDSAGRATAGRESSFSRLFVIALLDFRKVRREEATTKRPVRMSTSPVCDPQSSWSLVFTSTLHTAFTAFSLILGLVGWIINSSSKKDGNKKIQACVLKCRQRKNSTKAEQFFIQ